MKMEDYFHCSAKIRIENCTKTTNVCCLQCDDAGRCSSVNKFPRPCNASDLEQDEICEFAV